MGNSFLMTSFIDLSSPMDNFSKNHGTHALLMEDANMVIIIDIVYTRLYNPAFSLSHMLFIIILSEDPSIVPAKTCGTRGIAMLREHFTYTHLKLNLRFNIIKSRIKLIIMLIKLFPSSTPINLSFIKIVNITVNKTLPQEAHNVRIDDRLYFILVVSSA